jgi:predicted SAM-dependent methyltransferase
MNNKLKLFLKKTKLIFVLISMNRSCAKLVRGGKIKRYLDSHEIRKLQIGSGKNVLEGWLNTDIKTVRSSNKGRGEDSVFLDATKRFPFKDGTFDYVFCEHLIEHMEYQEGLRMLHECFRVLKPGGRMRISTPNMRFLIELYSPKKTALQKKYVSWAMKSFIPKIDIKEDVFVINNFFRAWGHKFIYDFKVLKETMESVGFAGVSPQKVSKSSNRNLRGLESHGDNIGNEFNLLETLIVEGKKPG